MDKSCLIHRCIRGQEWKTELYNSIKYGKCNARLFRVAKKQVHTTSNVIYLILVEKWTDKLKTIPQTFPYGWLKNLSQKQMLQLEKFLSQLGLWVL